MRTISLIFVCIGLLFGGINAQQKPATQTEQLSETGHAAKVQKVKVVIPKEDAPAEVSTKKEEPPKEIEPIKGFIKGFITRAYERFSAAMDKMYNFVSAQQLAGYGKWYVIFFAFIFGILISFTPCVYPMIPITAAILQAQATTSAMRNFFLAVSYVTGTALVYATLGYLAATGHLIFGAWLGNPYFIAFIVAFFLYLSGAMFGFYDVYIPGFMRARTGIETKGSLLYSFFAGIVAGTVASPCLTPALGALLVYVAKLGQPVLGFLTLFSFSWGMGTLLVFVGMSSSNLAKLPKAGAWMVEVKRAFGFMLLGVCLYFVQPLLSAEQFTNSVAALLLLAALYYAISYRRDLAARAAKEVTFDTKAPQPPRPSRFGLYVKLGLGIILFGTAILIAIASRSQLNAVFGGLLILAGIINVIEGKTKNQRADRVGGYLQILVGIMFLLNYLFSYFGT